uniref:Uncharacterized protein n=1 Tax=Arundo donax TaxID=35708 RepID=A0A0A8ZFT3_ARUDO
MLLFPFYFPWINRWHLPYCKLDSRLLKSQSDIISRIRVLDSVTQYN